MIIVFGIIYFIAILMCFVSPLIMRIFIFGVNMILPDPIPYVDEFLMGMGVLSKLLFVAEHPKLSIFIIVLLCGGIGYLIVSGF